MRQPRRPRRGAADYGVAGMTDLEITLLCAAAMGHEGFSACTSGPFASQSMVTKRDGEQSVVYYDPLNMDAQCFALVKKFELRCQEPEAQPSGDRRWRVTAWEPCRVVAQDIDLNRAVCTVVATQHLSRQQQGGGENK